MTGLRSLIWPAEQPGAALDALARKSGLADAQSSPSAAPADANGKTVDRWLATAAAHLGLETEPALVPYVDLADFLPTAGPALLRLPDGGYLVLLNGRRAWLSLLAPDGSVESVPLERVRAELARPLETAVAAEVEGVLDAAGVPQRRRAAAHRTILRQRLGQQPVDCGWLLELSPGAPFWSQLKRVGFPGQLAAFIIAHTVQYGLFLLSWYLVGRAVFQGRADLGWLLAWGLILLTIIPLRLLGTWLQGMAAAAVGGLLQKRLLFGALRLQPDEIRHLGAGQLMGRVFEAEAVESLSLSGGVRGLTAVIELVLAGWVLSQGAGGWPHALLLLGWTTVIAWAIYRFYQRRRRWTSVRRDLTHDLIENMVGHRTRLAQSPPAQWHEGEDEALAGYVAVSDGVDRAGALLEAVTTRGWLMVGLLGLVPAFVGGEATPAGLAIGLGGVLSASLAMNKLALGLINQLLAAAIAWEQIEPLFRAAARPVEPGLPETAVSTPDPGEALLDAHGLSFRYQAGGDFVLRGCDLRMEAGDRVLLQGPSGGGKSTLAALLTGLRRPAGGLLLWRGLDRPTLGADGWRRQITAAPQFHENHVLGGTFLFNLLMGRGWPPRAEDMVEVEAVCRELGLDDVLARMPAGLLQTIGETGWQLSHGERSRLYIARALLQGAELIVLDESFAALDPESLQRAIVCVLDRAPTLLVIAHP